MDVAGLFKVVAADSRGKAESPTVGTTEWNQWLEWANEEYKDWAEVSDWEELKSILPITGGTSLGISNYKKIAGYPIIGGYPFTEVDYDQYDLKSGNYFRHGYSGGDFIEWNPIHTSGCSGYVPVVQYPTSLATTSDQIVMRNPYYLAKRLKTRIFKYRKDALFTEFESEADILLQQMLENENYKHSQYRNGITTAEEEADFVLGID